MESMFTTHLVDTIDSTNEALKRLVKQESGKMPDGVPDGICLSEKEKQNNLHGTVIIARHQIAGKGRRGRSFYSPEDTGLYMSILFRPDLSMQKIVRITTMAAAAVSCAIEKVTGKKAEIKWVNDIYVGGRKVVGILTEAGIQSKSQAQAGAQSMKPVGAQSRIIADPQNQPNMTQAVCDYAILGIGVNLWEPEGGFPEEIRDIAGALNIPVKAGSGGSAAEMSDAAMADAAAMTERDAVRLRLAKEILDQIEHFYPELTKASRRTYMDEYRRRSIVLDQWVTVLTPDHELTDEIVHVEGIGEEAELIVTGKNGERRCVMSGEVSIRL